MQKETVTKQKKYFFVASDDGKNFFDIPERLIEFLANNTSENELVEVGSEELTDTEWARLSDNGDEAWKPYKDEDRSKQDQS